MLVVVRAAKTDTRVRFRKDRGGGRVVDRFYKWWCRCDCGRMKSIRAVSLKCGASESCGCRQNRIGEIAHAAAVRRREKIDLPPPVRGARWIPLTQGKFALVDADRFAELNEFTWFAAKATKSGELYACRGIVENGRSLRTQSLHRQVLDITDPGIHVDHKNGKTLDCRRNNLRVATRSGNGANRRKFRTHKGQKWSSKYKGVTFRPTEGNRWLAMIRFNDVRHRIGLFDDEIDAAKAYDAAARNNFGEFACLNFPRRGERSALH
jgi:hypothetical protein